ncbi:MAG: lytic murein transglycosylase [Shewanella sp.]|nr:lytic murein transglycosylase [Shewanella sp.]MCF1431000.1 lytic murein transglycosylase [Shewanella sp.]MCF1458062.1 lytic murein transglycosylase [Shewanella sp.]
MKRDFIAFSGLLLAVHFAVLADDAQPDPIQVKQGKPEFEQYLARLQQQVSPLGFDPQWLSQQFADVKRFKKVTPVASSLDTYPAQTLEQFLPNRFTQSDIDAAATALQDHASLLQQLQQEYGIQPRFLVALWAVAGNLSRADSAYPLLSVTSSLAYEGELAEDEVIAALRLLQNEQFDKHSLVALRDASIAGSGFSASQLVRYGRDGDHDGVIDHQRSVADILASYAFFLSKHGWNAEQIWGRQVTLPEDLSGRLGMEYQAGFEYWQNAGIRRFNGDDLPRRTDIQASLLQPDGQKGRAYLVYDNYRALLAWQDDHYFALSVSYLSERVKAVSR